MSVHLSDPIRHQGVPGYSVGILLFLFSPDCPVITAFFSKGWFIKEGHFPALQSFIEEVLANHTDVYFVTSYQAMNWIRNPVAVGNQKLTAFDCPARTDVPDICAASASACSELPPSAPGNPSGQFFTCRPSSQPGVHSCPQFYPWVRGHTERSRSPVCLAIFCDCLQPVLSVSLPVCLSVCLSWQLSVALSTRQFVCLSSCLFIRLSDCPSACTVLS